MAKSAGAVQLRIRVVGDNANALKFWKKAGFQGIGRTPDMVLGLKTHTAIELARDII